MYLRDSDEIFLNDIEKSSNLNDLGKMFGLEIRIIKPMLINHSSIYFPNFTSYLREENGREIIRLLANLQ